MTSTITLICDGCGEEITDRGERVGVTITEVRGDGPGTSAQQDYHPDHVPQGIREVLNNAS
jgi:hypothetical protein